MSAAPQSHPAFRFLRQQTIDSLNISIPSRISIIGYNHLDIGQAVNPKLTSIFTPRYEMGELSASILLDAIEGKRDEKKVHDVGFFIKKGGSF